MEKTLTVWMECMRTSASEISRRLRESQGKIASEAQTRISLIDPTLKLLGWEIENPDEVVVEYQNRDGKKKPDYILLDEGRAVATIEAKKCGWSFTKKIRDQAEKNSQMAETSICIASDGQDWLGWAPAYMREEAVSRDEIAQAEGAIFAFRLRDLETPGKDWETLRQKMLLTKPMLIESAKKRRLRE